LGWCGRRQHALLAKPLSSLATLLHVMGNETATAWALAQRAYSIRLRAFGDAHSEVADSASTLGLLHLAAGNVERALEWHRQAHSVWSAVYGPNHPQVCLCPRVALTTKSCTAYAACPRTRLIREVCPSAEPQVAMALSNIAAVYAAQAKFAQALQARQQCLLIERRSLGETHPQVGAHAHSRLSSTTHPTSPGV
jgi:tetratricopeptide (TPR) repeat protein